MKKSLKILIQSLFMVFLRLSPTLGAGVILRTKQDTPRYLAVGDGKDLNKLLFTKNREDAYKFVLMVPALNNKYKFVSIKSADGDMFIRSTSRGFFTLEARGNKRPFRRDASFKKIENKFLKDSVSFYSNFVYFGNYNGQLRAYAEDEAEDHRKEVCFEIIDTEEVEEPEPTNKTTEKYETEKWTSCSQTCGKGRQQLIQNCPTTCKPVYRECSLHDCFVKLRGWTECSKSCGGGVTALQNCRGSWCRKFRKTCNTHSCVEIPEKVEMCTNNPCVNGKCEEVLGGYACKCNTPYTGDHCDISVAPTDGSACSPNPCQNGGECTSRSKGHKFGCACVDGYVGKTCEKEIKRCKKSTCRNGGRCSTTDNGLPCTCIPGYTGFLCEKTIERCEDKLCQNGGQCSNSNNGFPCTCNSGYTGSLCEKTFKRCKRKACRNGGRCSTTISGFPCTCLVGFTGLFCDTIVDRCEPNPCQNGGKCSSSGSAVFCTCADGFMGIRCEQTIDLCVPNPCQNGGKCSSSDRDVSCTCPDGLTGVLCENIIIDRCVPNPCQNGGRCSSIGFDVTCTCPLGYIGVYCDDVIDRCKPKNPCQNGGRCSSSDVDYTCNCADGFMGMNCEIVDRCEPYPCKNGGRCSRNQFDEVCTCQDGFTGEFCEKMVDHCDSNPCIRGSCTTSPFGFLCFCPPGYTGDRCTIVVNRCEPTPCQNGGKCLSSDVDISCICTDGFKGVLCEEIVDRCEPNPCQNGGRCSSSDVDISCICTDRFKGMFCEEKIDQCESKPCQNGGVCSNTPEGFSCSCREGFRGVKCLEVTQIDVCSPSPCLNGGTCVSTGEDYWCVCTTGFKGEKCENLEEWDVYSECTKTCGGGSRYKVPKCQSDDITKCPRVYESCNLGKCPDAPCNLIPGQVFRYKQNSGCCTLPPETQGCGITNFGSSTRRIIGGILAEYGQWPWAALLHIESSPLSNSTCGGTLIHKRWLITAAHCLEAVDKSRIVAILGTTNSALSHLTMQTRKVEKIVLHESYSFPTGDIALLKLETAVNITTHVHPICLPMGERPKDDSICYATGWGIARVEDIVKGISSDDLMQVGLKKLNLKVCLSGYATTPTGQFIDTKMLCAGSIDGGVDTCMGDSGGPLMCQRCNSCSWYLAGITSFGAANCGVRGLPGVYTDVSQYEKWIRSHVDTVNLGKHKCSV